MHRLFCAQPSEQHACPLRKREHNGKFFALQYDCQNCEFNLAVSSVCLCLATAHIKSLTDFGIPIEKRKMRFIELQKENEAAIIAQRAVQYSKSISPDIKHTSFSTSTTPAINPEDEPGYTDVCSLDPNSNTPVYDRLRKRWYWCIECHSWMLQRNMAFWGFSYGTNKGICKGCHRKKLSHRNK